MCLSAYQRKLANERARISAVIVKFEFAISGRQKLHWVARQKSPV
jgi:hypothetical protein